MRGEWDSGTTTAATTHRGSARDSATDTTNTSTSFTLPICQHTKHNTQNTKHRIEKQVNDSLQRLFKGYYRGERKSQSADSVTLKCAAKQQKGNKKML